MSDITPKEILDFWYTPPMNKFWFDSTEAIDQEIREKYETLWEEAQTGALDEWLQTPEGALALCIVLDQFPLNMFRGEAKSFASEHAAQAASRYAIEHDYHHKLPKTHLAFLFTPLMHSEHLKDQALSVKMFNELGLTLNAGYAQHHHDIVLRFGRFPHRNAILGRSSTDRELEYLKSEEAFTG